MKNKVLFLTLKIFSATGGIEKVCRIAGKAMLEIVVDKQMINIFSLYDSTSDINEKYFPANIFKGFSSKKVKFMFESARKAFSSQVVILSHVNLLIVGFFIKFFSPKTKLVLYAHGIEVWKILPFWKKKMLNRCDLVISVSRFTENKMKALYNLPDEKFVILHNSLDPYLPKHSSENRSVLQSKYGINEKDFIIMTLSRLSYTEKNKNYDKILIALKELKSLKDLKYLFVGKYDEAEKKRLDIIIKKIGLKSIVTLTGFIPDEHLADYYDLADVFIIPSEKEGFGIVFIEAMYYGKPVIAGNRDGSTDALADGQLGILIDPQNQEEITGAIKKVMENKNAFIPNRELLLSKFSYPVYKNNLRNILNHLQN